MRRKVNGWGIAGLLAVVAASAACSPPPCYCRPRQAPVQPPGDGQAQVTFLRPAAGLNVVHLFDAADGRLLATTTTMTRATVTLPAGRRTIVGLTRAHADVMQLDLAPGKHYYALVRYIAVPFGPDFALRTLTPTSEDWSSLGEYMDKTNPIELDPAHDPEAVNRMIRGWERRLPEAMDKWESLSPAHQAERTLAPTDSAPLRQP